MTVCREQERRGQAHHTFVDPAEAHLERRGRAHIPVQHGCAAAGTSRIAPASRAPDPERNVVVTRCPCVGGGPMIAPSTISRPASASTRGESLLAGGVECIARRRTAASSAGPAAVGRKRSTSASASAGGTTERIMSQPASSVSAASAMPAAVAPPARSIAAAGERRQHSMARFGQPRRQGAAHGARRNQRDALGAAVGHVSRRRHAGRGQGFAPALRSRGVPTARVQ